MKALKIAFAFAWVISMFAACMILALYYAKEFPNNTPLLFISLILSTSSTTLVFAVLTHNESDWFRNKAELDKLRNAYIEGVRRLTMARMKYEKDI